MNNLTVTYLFNFAMAHNIQFEATHLLHPGTPSCCNTTNRKMVINLNNDEEGLPLEIAHEIGHIFNGDKGKFYLKEKKTMKDKPPISLKQKRMYKGRGHEPVF